MMTQLYAHRLAEFGIPVFEIRPGIIETDMTASVKEKYDRLIAEGLTPNSTMGKVGRRCQGSSRHRPGFLPFFNRRGV